MSALEAPIYGLVDARTLAIVERRRASAVVKGRGWLMRRMLLASDLLGLGIAFAVAEVAFAPDQRVQSVSDLAVFVVALPLWILSAKLAGLYARDEERADYSTADDVSGVFQLLTIAVWLLYLGTYVTGIAHPQLPKLATFWTLSVVALPLLRALARSHCRRSIEFVQNTLIVGAGEVGQQVARKLLKHPEYGLNLVGFVDAEQTARHPEVDDLPLLGELEDVPALIELLDVERVIVAFSSYPLQDLVGLVRDLNALAIQVDVVPRFFEILSPAIAVHGVEGLPLVGLGPPRLARSDRLLKRALDLVGAVVALIVLAPLFALIAAAVKLDSRGPVFFRQVRMGGGDRTFRIVKFRTMAADAEARKAEVVHLNEHARNGGDPRMFKLAQDPRVTGVGRWLRRLSLDELPQLWNVVRGEMSLVGPRPLPLDEDRYVEDWARRRLNLKPGITGLWQVLGRSEIPFHEMVRLDYVYVTGWSLLNDVRLILRTLPLLARPSRGAY